MGNAFHDSGNSECAGESEIPLLLNTFILTLITRKCIFI